MDAIDLNETVFTIPVRVALSSMERQTQLMGILKDRHVLDATILTERTPFFWEAEISSSVIDSHFTHMRKSTLTNFRDDAITGVAALPGHQHHNLPYGRSIDGVLEDVDNPQRTRVLAAFYTLPGLNLNGIKTDDLIDGLRSGILRDKSVGFFGGSHVCDACNLDFWDMRCPHVPGLRYDVERDGKKQTIIATFGVDNAHLSEVSNVFDGSTPRAEVLKAEREVKEGRLRGDAIRILEQRYRVKLPAPTRAFAGVTVQGQTPGKVERMNPEQFTQLTNTLVRAGVLSEEQRENESEALAATDKLAKRVAELEPQAADGRQYRSDLVAEALAEGVRAYGDKFDRATYEGMLTNAPIATIKRMRDDWQTIGNERFAGGRQSQDDGDAEKETSTPVEMKRRLPDAAFRG